MKPMKTYDRISLRRTRHSRCRLPRTISLYAKYDPGMIVLGFFIVKYAPHTSTSIGQVKRLILGP